MPWRKEGWGFDKDLRQGKAREGAAREGEARQGKARAPPWTRWGRRPQTPCVWRIPGREGTWNRHSTTRPATQFTGSLLNGCWHKHYTHENHLVHNILVETGRDRTVNRIMGKYIGKIVSSDAVDEIVHAIVIENYAKRSQQERLTGERIVFAKTPTGNVYLTLASHQEIADRVAACQTFGFLGKD